MNLRIILPLLAATICAPTAHADKFHVGPAEAAEQMTEGEPYVIEGVLLREEEDRYVIRVVGGEIQLPKAQVREIEKDELTVTAIEEQEQEQADRLAREDAERRQRQAVARAERRAELQEIRAREASMRREQQQLVQPVVVPVEAGMVTREVYDPVLDVVRTLPVAPNAGVGEFYVEQLIRNELGGLLRRHVQDELRDVRRDLRRALRR